MSGISESVESNLNKIHDCLSSFLADTSVLNAVVFNKSSNNESNILPTCRMKDPSKRQSVKKITQPNSILDFHMRLSSFKFGSWTVSGISPILCARYGWKLKCSNMLKCVTCGALICTSLPPASIYDAYIEFRNMLKDSLVNRHKDWCGWSYNQSPEEFACPPLAFSVHYIENLKNDIKILTAHQVNLPLLHIGVTLQKLQLEEWQLRIFFDNQDTLEEEQLTAALLVLLGWSYKKNNYLKCSVCLRKIGLWNFVPLGKKIEYLKLKEQHTEKQKRKEIQEARKIEREKDRVIREEARKQMEGEKIKILKEKERIANEVAEKEAKEDEERRLRREERRKTFEALNYEELIDQHINEIEEEVNEKEEQVLLGELNDKCAKAVTLETTTETLKSQTIEIDAAMECIENDGIRNVKSDESADNLNTKDDNSAESLHRETCKSNEVLSHSHSGKIIQKSGKLEEIQMSENNKVQSINTEGLTVTIQDKNLSSSLRNNDELQDCNDEDDHCNDDDDLWLEAVGCDQANKSSTSSDENQKFTEGNETVGLSASQKRKRSCSSDGDYDLSSIQKHRKCTGSDAESSEESIKSSPIQQISTTIVYNLLDKNIAKETLKGENNIKIKKVIEDQQMSSEKLNDQQSFDSIDEVEEDTEEDRIYQKMITAFFDPFEEHRAWCGWLSKYSSSGNDMEISVPGFLILPGQLKNILPESPRQRGSLLTSEAYKKNIEGLRTIRSTLYEWEADLGDASIDS